MKVSGDLSRAGDLSGAGILHSPAECLKAQLPQRTALR
jgi:hypothetical protein